MKWRRYQEEVAELLKSLGFSVAIEAKVSGARAKHSIDVHATKSAYGFVTTWIVECKYWKKAVPKEKVLALSQIVTDVGADRGFLLSESGFQSGAILAAKHTNITLTSLPDLRVYTQAELTRLALEHISQKAYELNKATQDHFHPGVYGRADGVGSRALDLLARIFALKTLELPRAQAADFPVQTNSGLLIKDLNEFVAYAQAELGVCSEELDDVVKLLATPSDQVPRLTEEFALTVKQFLACADAVFDAASDEDRERGYMEALTSMRRIGRQAKGLKFMLQPDERLVMSTVMRALSDGPYLLVTEISTSASEWEDAVRKVMQALAELSQEVQATQAKARIQQTTQDQRDD